MTIINVSTPNRWLLAVSDAASNGVISGSTVWTYYFIIPATQSPAISNGSSILSDYPTLGIDANALYVGVDEFVASTGAFQQTDVFVVRKSSVLSGGPIVVTVFRALMSAASSYAGPYAPRGVDNPDPGSNEGYVIGPDGASWGTMWIERITNPGGTPSISSQSITLPAEDGARPVVHPGNTGGYWGYLDPLDDRYFQATIRNQQLWTVHNIGVDNTGVSQGTYTGDARCAARWYQVNVPVSSGTATIVQAGTVFTASANNDSLQKNYFVPSLNVTGQGHVAMGFSTAGTSNYVNAEVVGRLASDPLGTMETPAAMTTNTSSTYNPASDPGGVSAGRPRRWGDYSQTTVDPLDDQTVWTVQQFVDANNSYGVRVARLLAPPPATPSALADVTQGQSSVSVTLTGVSASGSGFFDPGADLASPARPFNHLSAAITTGAATGTPPTVTSATYVNPTTVNLVLNASAATANLAGQAYTITITNPDGQTAAGAVVHVVTAGFTITASAGAGGSISPSGAVQVASGGSQAFTITPDACHTIADVLVDGASVGAVTSYTFTNVTAAHTIAASFAIKTFTITASTGAHGSITPSGGVSVNCGANQSFTIAADACAHIQDVLVDGASVGAVTGYTFTNVTAVHTIAASFTVGVAPPAAVTALGATQVKSGNGGASTTGITLSFTAPGGASVEVWRRGFGSYPFYASSPGTGAAPTAPGVYPPAGWTLTGVTATGQVDHPGARDFWYYVAYAKDACGNASAVSNMTGGTLDYHLGDFSDGVTPGQGDDAVNVVDVSLLGMHYGASGAGLAGFSYLDVGPTTDNSTNARPTADGVVDFEDLVMVGLNYAAAVSAPARAQRATPLASGGANVVASRYPAAVRAGDAFDVTVELSGNGTLQALSTTLDWDASVVRPVDVSAGALLASQGGVVLSPGPGRADATLLGVGQGGIAGQGAVATLRFQALTDGAPGITVASAIGRDARNQRVPVDIQGTLAAGLTPPSTELLPVIPNPTRGSSTVQFGLAQRGVVNLAIYSVDGRLVRSLVHGVQEAGRYQFVWDGQDDHGTPIRSGMFFVRLEAGGLRKTRVLSVIR